MSSGGPGSARIEGLDGLRAVSISFVIFDHLCISGWIPFHQTTIDFGNLGVRIFFVISGFIITTLLMREKVSVGRVSLRGFYTRRVFRIVPLLAIYVLAVATFLNFTHRGLPPRDLWIAATFNADYFSPSTVDFIGLWSLSVEEKFYLCWPLVLKYCRVRTAFAVGLAAIVLPPLQFKDPKTKCRRPGCAGAHVNRLSGTVF